MIEIEYLEEIEVAIPRHDPFAESKPVYSIVQDQVVLIDPTKVIIARTFNGFLSLGSDDRKDAKFIELTFGNNFCITALYSDTLLSELKSTNPNPSTLVFEQSIPAPNGQIGEYLTKVRKDDIVCCTCESENGYEQHDYTVI